MTATKNAAPAKNAVDSTNDDLAVLQTANLDLNKVLDSSSEEVADLYGESLYPLFAPSDEKGRIKPYSRDKMVQFLDRIKPKLKKAAMKDGLNGALAVLKSEGLHFDVRVTGKASEAFQLEEKASFNWGEFFKWAGGIAAVAVIAYGGYVLYVKYNESKKASGTGTGNAIAM